jgi:hypothetical protein
MKAMPKITKSKKSMTSEHKAALAEGRDQGRSVRAYLEGLEAHKPKRGRKRTPDSIQKRLDRIAEELPEAIGIDRLHLIQEQADLESELANASVAIDMTDLEAAFIESASAYSERKGITYDTWRKMGVAPAVLRAAGIRR